MKFRRRAIVTDAEKWNGSPGSADAIRAMGATFVVEMLDVKASVELVPNAKLTTKLGVVEVPIGHWVVRTGLLPAQREFWAQTPEVFEADYELDI